MDVHWFADLHEAKRLIEPPRWRYNESRPHLLLGERAPSDLADWNLNQPMTIWGLGVEELGLSDAAALH